LAKYNRKQKPKKKITIFNAKKLSKCNFGHHNNCNLCEHINTNKCTLPLVFADANTILEYFLQQKDMAKSQQFINDHRHKHIIVTSHLIIGEITSKIYNNKDIGDTRLKELIDPTIPNSPFQNYIQQSFLIETHFEDENFIDIFTNINNINSLRSLDRDRLIIAILVYYNKYKRNNVQICTVDDNLIKDIKTINSECSYKKIKLYSI
jgi:hypothetical protein